MKPAGLLLLLLGLLCCCCLGVGRSARFRAGGFLGVAGEDHEVLFRVQEQIRRNIKQSSDAYLTKSCPEVGNATFSNAPPFGHLVLPDCGDVVKPKMVLYLPPKDGSNKTTLCELDPFYTPNKKTSDCFDLINQDQKIWKLTIATHGFLDTFSEPWLHHLQKEIFKYDSGVAVILVGWDAVIQSVYNYDQAASNTRYLGQSLYHVLLNMHSVVKRPLQTQCIGHSLGAHACGFTGKNLIVKDIKLRLNRIDGLDPAGPLFANDVGYPYDVSYKISPTARLMPHDAEHVVNIHTDGKEHLNYFAQYGTMTPLGTVDFYTGANVSFGFEQPGCGNGFDSCSHSRAWVMFLLSTNSTMCLPSRVCHGNPYKMPENCMALDEKEEKMTMGYWWTPAHSRPGMYTVELTAEVPFCKNGIPVPQPKKAEQNLQAEPSLAAELEPAQQKLLKRQPKLPKWAMEDTKAKLFVAKEDEDIPQISIV